MTGAQDWLAPLGCLTRHILSIDLDSMHTARNLRSSLTTPGPGGALLVDDVDHNDSFTETFAGLRSSGAHP